VDGLAQLTERERQVVVLTALGLSASEAARVLGSTRGAIAKHRAAAKEKLAARSLPHLIFLLCDWREPPLTGDGFAWLLAASQRILDG
jgi:DNA-binding CsgD family transcriptional regulator